MTYENCNCGRSVAAHELADEFSLLLEDFEDEIISAGILPSHRVIETFVGMAMYHPEWMQAVFQKLEIDKIDDVRANCLVFIEALPMNEEN